MFNKSNLRKGSLYFDYSREKQSKAPSGSQIPYVDIHYYYDTLLHVNFAKLEDAEDWDNAIDLEISSINEMLSDLFNDLKNRPELNSLSKNEYALVTVSIYGAGNRSIDMKMSLNARWNEKNLLEWRKADRQGRSKDVDVLYEFDIDNQLDTYGVNATVGDKKFHLTTQRVQPGSNYVRRQVAPYIVNYLGEGFNNL